MIYGEVETGAGNREVVSSAEGFAGVDCCVLAWLRSAFLPTYKRKRL
jgi:hypothetical protein